MRVGSSMLLCDFAGFECDEFLFGPPFVFLQVIIYSARFWKQKN